MTLLVISPDYASHLLPLATIAGAWAEAGERVVVATGPATDGIVRRFGFERAELSLGRGSNPGVIRAEDQPRGEDEALRGFFEATRLGPVPTLAFQAAARRDDLLWEPQRVAREVQYLVDRVGPDQVIVDHLAFTARIGLTAARTPYADVVLGHPSALTVAGEVYGYPPAWPQALRPDPADLTALRQQCEVVRDAFTEQWNAALTDLDPGAGASQDAFAETGDVLLLNYPEQLHPPQRTALLPRHAFLGSSVRVEEPDDEVEAWLARGDAPIVYVSLGSFLSVRSDVLSRIAEALRGVEVRVALAAGSTPPEQLGPIPSSWLVRRELPQVTILEAAALAVSHGGNNSVTEAMTAGVPLLLLPLSTDQFAGAAAIETAGLGKVLDANAATPAELRTAAEQLLTMPAEAADRLARLSEDLTRTPGPQRARSAFWASRAGIRHSATDRATRHT
ncbi:glycosyltransferase, MGT family [Pedococcus dokdonensis]|uniref:Glycosyltransferase, MGT family n=1 Tax=Pedococcus dokdonensis TaxID=443156 RepID=A0A1H0NDB2_9MICO|nr:glycosyltransferase [Pedococcus dokdonensis]SDO90385.1 glycosyltransferase, MGT family [Pedococcus dokdonensis]